MNLVRLGMIATLGGIAYYALTIYAGLPSEGVGVGPTTVQQSVTYMCPAVSNSMSGAGMVFVAMTAVAGAIGIAAADLARRVY